MFSNLKEPPRGACPSQGNIGEDVKCAISTRCSTYLIWCPTGA